MTQEMDRWNQLSSLLDELLDADPGQRFRRLEEFGRDDPKLRIVLEELLDAHERQQQDPIEPYDPPDSAVASPTPEDDPRLGTAVGGYCLLERLGEGGMATVYRGVKEGATFEHPVAVKLVRRDRVSSALVERFRDEQRILASLNHPGIARLFDGGLTEDGQPFIVMELVEGLPLDRYCDEGALDVEDRLRLFSQICEAIEYAHANLVVHRDLKPNNILVTPDGAVKILDFGVAKLLEPAEQTPDRDDLTSLFGIPMTPAYAAPEQLAGEAVTTATDVYSLGLVLYELLIGQRAFPRTASSSTPEPHRRPTRDPRRPSQRLISSPEERQGAAAAGTTPEEIAARRSTTLPKLCRRLAGDLDIIVLKALRLEPERRYTSVLALREDLERHREQLPIRARPESWRYNLDRFVHRHRTAVIAGAAAALLLVSALAVAVAGWAAARREAATSERIARFLVETFRAPDPTTFRPGGQISATELLHRAAARVREGEDADPEVRARLMSAIGESFLGIGEYEAADRLAQEGLRLWTEVGGAKTPEILSAKNLQARVWIDLGRLDEAEALYEVMMDELEALPKHRELWATVVNDFGLLLNERGEFPRAETFFRRALEIHRQEGTVEGQEGIRVRNNLAVARRGQGDLEEAKALLQEVLRSLRQNLEEPHADIAVAVNNLARVVRAQGDLEAAEDLYRQALNQRRMVFGEDHPETAQSYNNLGALRYFQGDLEGASEFFETASRIWESFFEGDHPRLCAALSNLGSLRRKQGRFDEAETYLRKAAEMEARIHGDHHPRYSKALYRWADLRLEAGNGSEAIPLLEASLKILETSQGLADPATLETVVLLVRAYQGEGQEGRAAALLSRAREAAAGNPELLSLLEAQAASKV